MKLHNLIYAFIASLIYQGVAEADTANTKLVVGVVVDQMRADQLYRFKDKYTPNGFKKLLANGFNYGNAQYNYVPTVTSAGHASIHTGSTPSRHGIIENSWFDRSSKMMSQSVSDENASIIGSKAPNNNGASPKNLMTTTIADQIKMNSQLRSKVISISLKDRAAVLSGGHLANAAYWQDIQTSPGYFVSSSYYMEELPNWVKNFNLAGKSSEYLDNTWEPLFPLETYDESREDDNSYEVVLGTEKPTFPYNFKVLREKYRERGLEYLMLGLSPYGNAITTDFALEAIKHEGLGADDDTDFLAISYSVTDKIGHLFGPNSVELADIYIRLDLEIAKLIDELDKSVGNDNYILFLTSDHGAVPVASYLDDIGIPTGIAKINRYKNKLNEYLNKKYGEGDWIDNFEGNNIYLNRKTIRDKHLELRKIQQEASDLLVAEKEIREVMTASDLRIHEYGDRGFRHLVQNGYYPKRSGDLLIVFEPAVIQDDDSDAAISSIKGTIHGSNYAYDTHVPLMLFGANIKHGESVRKVSPIDIAATISMMLRISLPNGSEGEPLFEVFDK